MKVGDYVRTKNDGIQKIVKVTENNCLYITCTAGFDYHTSLDEEIIGQPSTNIIDLIEVGDYVNGYLVKYVSDDGVYIDIPFVDSESIGCNVDLIRTEEIETIVTKERFENMEYKVVE